MRFFEQGPSGVCHLQVVKEHVDIWRLVADINVQISALADRLVGADMRGQRISRSHLLKTAIGAHIFELLVEQHPVDKRLGLGRAVCRAMRGEVTDGSRS
jgi:hypothetical protein